MTDVTRILSAIQQGDPHAAAQLLPLVYDELRKLAAEKMAQEKPGQTLEATALVHEAYLRLAAGERPSSVPSWDSHRHLLAAAIEAMHRISPRSPRTRGAASTAAAARTTAGHEPSTRHPARIFFRPPRPIGAAPTFLTLEPS
jgi:hypothetical protein